jgi:hypothetical protein
MAIQPIDLQTMYAQMSGVAQNVAHQQQGVKLAESMQQQTVIEKNKEQSERVQRSADEEAKVMIIKEDNSGSLHENKQQQKKKQNENTNDLKTDKDNTQEIHEAYLGQHIDITR